MGSAGHDWDSVWAKSQPQGTAKVIHDPTGGVAGVSVGPATESIQTRPGEFPTVPT